MAKLTTKELMKKRLRSSSVAMLNADIKFAKMIGDKEFAALMTDAKDKLLRRWVRSVLRSIKKFTDRPFFP